MHELEGRIFLVEMRKKLYTDLSDMAALLGREQDVLRYTYRAIQCKQLLGCMMRAKAMNCPLPL